jgi:hypothetical protein
VEWTAALEDAAAMAESAALANVVGGENRIMQSLFVGFVFQPTAHAEVRSVALVAREEMVELAV